MLMTDIARYLTQDTIAVILEKTPAPETPTWARVFSRTNLHPQITIAIRTNEANTQNVPLINRGNSSIPLYFGQSTDTMYEPQTISLNTIISAKDFQDLAQISKVFTLETWLASKVNGLRDSTYKTIEALCCQALNGTIDYALKAHEGTLSKYYCDFGNLVTAPTLTGSILWDDEDKTIEQIAEDLLNFRTAITDNASYGGKMGILAGKGAFFALMGKMTTVNTNPTKISIEVKGDILILNGYTIEYFGDAGYKDPADGSDIPCIPATDIIMFSEDAPFTMNFLALDVFDKTQSNNLVVDPFYVRNEFQSDPDGLKVMSMSKPFPIPVTISTLKVTVSS